MISTTPAAGGVGRLLNQRLELLGDLVARSHRPFDGWGREKLEVRVVPAIRSAAPPRSTGASSLLARPAICS